MLDALVTDLLAEFKDEEGNGLAPGEYIHRAAERSLPLVAADLGVLYELAGDEVTPAMSGEHRELWALRTKVFVCRFLRAQAANRVSFSSADKSMDRSKEAANWASLENDLAAEYAERVKRNNPPADDALLRLDVRPMIYESKGHREGQQ